MANEGLQALNEKEYAAEVVPVLAPGVEMVVHRRKGDKRFNPSLLLVRFAPVGGPEWFGAFARGGFGIGVEGLFAAGARRECYVLALGSAYAVRVDRPQDVSFIGGDPVGDVVSSLERGWVVMVSLTDIVLCQPGGTWTSPRISYSALRNSRVTGNLFEAEGWSAPHNAWLPVKIDLDRKECICAAFP
ncbi:MAG: hypothetical protein AB1601_03985 [Planctomycetota bacterium]